MGKRQKPNKGEQIVNKLDLNKVVIDFIKFFFESWTSDVNKIISSDMIKQHTKINIDSQILNIQQFFQFLKTFEHSHFHLDKFQFVPDGARRIDINIKVNITKNSISKFFIINIALVEIKGQFYIKYIQAFFI